MSFKEMNEKQLQRFIEFFHDNYGGMFDWASYQYRINGIKCNNSEEAFLAAK